MKSHQELNQIHHYYYQAPIMGAGLNLLLPSGSIIRNCLEQRIRSLLDKAEYQPLYSPHLGNQALYEQSGHYPYYADSMFPPLQLENQSYLVKPMNCPFHIQAYQSERRSYRDLPIKYYEFGNVYRMESAGALNGLLRARSFVQDDGHLFVSQEQVGSALLECVNLLREVMKWFNFVPKLKLSLRNPDSDKYIGDASLWDKMEAQLKDQLNLLGVGYEVEVGGAAFYGPKLDFSMQDNQGRDWQLGTVQLDFNLPERFNLSYQAKDGSFLRPVLIHRALLGSIERFMAVLIEQYQGKLPFWLSPVQIAVVYAKPENLAYAKELQSLVGFRKLPLQQEANLKEQLKSAYEKGASVVLVVGPKEEAARAVCVQLGASKEIVPLNMLENHLKKL